MAARAVLALALGLAGTGASPAQPAGWLSGDRQGSAHHIVWNDAKSNFLIHCPDGGSASAKPGLTLNSSRIKGGPAHQEMSLLIDGKPDSYRGKCGGGECSWRSSARADGKKLAGTIGRLRTAKTFSVEIAALGVTERFTTQNANTILTGALDVCGL